ncbi:Rz1-like lysis system protein LysC [Rodentibacter caecimuris]|uniref:Rz1-like lysis system protein LysC n=2 Tax=Rodentibacter caecimuris TaxID=1796644 RepID=UPI0008565863|nr:hypothetical protein AC062_2360 [Pasteurellaceae bacterium NI1060]
MLLCLPVLLTNCASKPEIEYRTIAFSPPVSLLAPCMQPTFHGSTFGETVEYALLLKQELKLCGNKVEGIREYVEARKSAVENGKEK